eukprot:m.624717 g.624717  ORF g.624717 m.624717 type:complete len:204 (-) comp58236_c0_seq2:193-804(-)
MRGSFQCYRHLRDAGADCSQKSKWGQNALHLAASVDDSEFLDLLLQENIADLNSRDENGKTPLMKAASERNIVWLQHLLAAGADRSIRDKYGSTVLHHAVKAGCLHLLGRLLKQSSQDDVNAQTEEGDTPLMCALRSCQSLPHWEKNFPWIVRMLIRLLLAHGADVRIKNKSGQTAEILAGWSLRDDFVKLLQDCKHDGPSAS